MGVDIHVHRQHPEQSCDAWIAWPAAPIPHPMTVGMHS